MRIAEAMLNSGELSDHQSSEDSECRALPKVSKLAGDGNGSRRQDALCLSGVQLYLVGFGRGKV
jgi:hypothetical protein